MRFSLENQSCVATDHMRNIKVLFFFFKEKNPQIMCQKGGNGL